MDPQGFPTMMVTFSGTTSCGQVKRGRFKTLYELSNTFRQMNKAMEQGPFIDELRVFELVIVHMLNNQ